MAILAYTLTIVFFIAIIILTSSIIALKRSKQIAAPSIFWQVPEPIERIRKSITTDSTLEECLVRFFDQTVLSKVILKALVSVQNSLSVDQIKMLIVAENSKLNGVPEEVIKKAIMILMGAGFAYMPEGRFCITNQGRSLMKELITRDPKQQQE